MRAMSHAADSRHAAIRSAISARQARVTEPRVRVLDLLQSAPEPLRHAEIEEELGREGHPAIDRVTLYRVLDWLVGAGLAHKAADAAGVFRFSAADPDQEHTHHAHFRCTRCGGVFCLDMPAPTPPELPDGFRFGSMTLDIRGECPRCAGSAR